jgi:hypothetical protein
LGQIEGDVKMSKLGIVGLAAPLTLIAGMAMADCRAEPNGGQPELLKRIFGETTTVGQTCVDTAVLAASRGRDVIMNNEGTLTIQCPGESKQIVGGFSHGRVWGYAQPGGC